MSDIVTIADVIALSQIIDTASQTAKVAWADDEGNLHYGIARHIVRGADDYGFLGNNEDVRDGFLRVTMKSGFETTLSVRTLMGKIAKGEFAQYDW